MRHCPSAQTEKTKLSCKDDCTLTKHTWRWTYFALQYLFYLYSLSLGDALTTAAVRPFFNHVWSLHRSLVTPYSVNYKIAMFLSSLESFVQIIPCFACWTHFQDSSVSGCRITNSKISSCDSWDFVWDFWGFFRCQRKVLKRAKDSTPNKYFASWIIINIFLNKFRLIGWHQFYLLHICNKDCPPFLEWVT